jgi:hypothetical protein
MRAPPMDPPEVEMTQYEGQDPGTGQRREGEIRATMPGDRQWPTAAAPTVVAGASSVSAQNEG